MIKMILLLSCLILPVQANETIVKVQWPDKIKVDKNNTIGFNSYKLYFKNKMTNIYFDTNKKAVLIDFKNKNEMVIGNASDKQIHKIKTNPHYIYENDNYIAYFESKERPVYDTIIVIPKQKNDYIKELIVVGYFNKNDVEVLLSLL